MKLTVMKILNSEVFHAETQTPLLKKEQYLILYLRKSQMNADTQVKVRRRLTTREMVMLTQEEQGVGGAGRGRGTDTPRAKSATSTI